MGSLMKTGGSELKKHVNWPRILLAIIVTFESLRRSTECLFLPIKKTAATIHILSPQSTHEDNIVYYKAVKVMINAPGFAEVILNIVVRYHCLLGSVVINSSSFSLPKI